VESENEEDFESDNDDTAGDESSWKKNTPLC
jgi:hypothetical protein